MFLETSRKRDPSHASEAWTLDKSFDLTGPHSHRL